MKLALALLLLLPIASPQAEAPDESTSPAVLQDEPASDEGAAAADAHEADSHAAGAEEGHGGGGAAATIMHHVMDTPFFDLPFPSKHLVFVLLPALLVIGIVQLAVRSYKGGQNPGRLGQAVEALVVFIRDDIAEANIGHGDGRKFTPLLCSFFFFILTAALLGLVPLPYSESGKWGVAGTVATGNLAVTMALAGISFIAQQYAGISRYGVVGHVKNLIPPGLPWPLLFIMVPVEFLSTLTKPFALMVRLFANMLAGHMVITALLVLIALMGDISPFAGWAMAPISIALALFIMLLEVLVAFIQAYIFTLLSAIFIGMYAHPEH